MSEPDDVVRLELERRGDDWTGRALWVDPEGFGLPAETSGPVGSPGEVLDELGLPIDAAEAERVTRAKTRERAALASDDGDGLDPDDPTDALERAWREETGSRDPQGPPVGWRPRGVRR